MTEHTWLSEANFNERDRVKPVVSWRLLDEAGRCVGWLLADGLEVHSHQGAEV